MKFKESPAKLEEILSDLRMDWIGLEDSVKRVRELFSEMLEEASEVRGSVDAISMYENMKRSIEKA